MKYQAPTGAADPSEGYVGRNLAAGLQGSRIPPKAVEHPQRELDHLIAYANQLRPADVDPPTEGDLQQVRKAIEGLINYYIDNIGAGAGFVLEADAYANLPIFPEIVTGGGNLTINASGGSVVVATGQEWTWRGIKRFSSTNIPVGERTFATLANKTYHLRWYPPGSPQAPLPANPNGRFYLRDVADAGYNPAAYTEVNANLDTRYDDMLVARVVTNGSNVANITPVYNRTRLEAALTPTINITNNSGADDSSGSATVALNWGRTPNVTASIKNATNIGASGVADVDHSIDWSGVTRYGLTITMVRDYASQMIAAVHVWS
jgi:hypothetical protein